MVKWSKIIAQQPETIENPKAVDIKSVFTEHPQTSQILPKINNVGFGKKMTTLL